MNKKRLSRIVLLLLVWLALSASVPAAAPQAPAPFGKQSPAKNATNQPTNITLTWAASSTPGVTYHYCLRTNKAACPPSKWINVGTSTSVVLQGLSPGTTYGWHVRAVDASRAYTYSDDDTWWQFSTQSKTPLPGAFNKLAPTDGQTGQPVSGLVLTWSASSLATSYQYCYDTNNNNQCDGSWTTVSGLTASLNGLLYEKTYYWQVRALNANGSVQANAGAWFSFVTRSGPPGGFNKTAPVNFAVNQPLALALTWGASSGAGVSYEYCLGTTPCTAASTWTSAGANLSASSLGLQYETTYYWQVRAVNAAGTTYANSGNVWSFTTPIAPPQSFGKSAPANQAADQPLSLVLSWAPSAGTNLRYEYCLSQSPCSPASTWLLAGAATAVPIDGLAYATTYSWQVRAINASGTTYANSGTLWQFTTQAGPPQAFVKLSPASAGSAKVPRNISLQWSPSSDAAHYFYCVDTVSHPANDTACSTGWVLRDATSSAPLNLAYNQTYYWQVYAENSRGSLQADHGAWWSFTTVAAPPPAFTKLFPANSALDQPLQPQLYWWTPPVADTTYAYCFAAAAACPGDSWTAIAENTPISLPAALAHATTYHWQVRATNSGGTVYANDDWWSLTTLKAPPTTTDQSFSTNEGVPLTAALSAGSNYGKNFVLYGSLPAGQLDLSADGSFTYTPAPDFNGLVTFQFVVSDGYNPPTAPHTAAITVHPVADVPLLDALAEREVHVGKQLTLWALAIDPDLPYGDHLTYSIDEPLPPGAAIDAATGFFHWTVAIDQPGGLYTFTVRVTDGAGLSAAQVIKITVIAPLNIYLPVITR